MKKISLVVLSFILLLSLIIPTFNHVQAAVSFKDVPSHHWAKKEIDYLVDNGIITGYKDGTFKPNNNVTNAQVALMLVRALKLNTNGRPNPNLTDVPSTYHAYKEIAAVIEEGIFPKEKKFNPNSPITREAMARVLAKAFKLQGNSGIYFTDVPTSYWAYQYIVKIALNNITTGYSDSTFKPKNTVTRAQFSAFIARSLNEAFKPCPENRSITSGLKLNPAKTYVYNSFDAWGSTKKATWSYSGTDNGQDIWNAVYESEQGQFSQKYSYIENKEGMTVGFYNADSGLHIPYPLTLNKKWSVNREGMTMNYAATSLTKTITTPAGTFHNVIEIKNDDGYYYYYVQGAGHILTVDATKKPAKKILELVKLH
ncbi:S-layer homology domain-containing protein [Bacillus songklensis]|uniref:S-layer homology domain-containing protein n=1 Tax=Bacillus songklensis TaxID=1069116 RepID=A0ABV8B381_9BACI